MTTAISAHDALTLANSEFFEVAILDGEVGDIPLSAFIRDLAALQPDLKILVFPPDNNPAHPLLDGLSIKGFLNKPFSSPEIGKALSSLFSDQSDRSGAHQQQVDELMKEWLQHPATGQRISSQILGNTSAHTVLLVINEKITAIAGKINNEAASNVTGFLSRYLRNGGNGELGRFLQLDGSNEDLLLYATNLVGSVILALLYTHDTSIQQVRRELNLVKTDFQQKYPTISELRQEIAERTVNEINTRNKTLETPASTSSDVSQDELDALNHLFDYTPETIKTEEPEVDTLADRTITEIKERSQKLSSLQTTPSGFTQSELDALTQLADLNAGETEQDKQNAAALAERTLAEIRERNKILASMQNPSANFSQSELDALDKMLEMEPCQPEVAQVSAENLAEKTLNEIRQRNQTLAESHTTGFSQSELDALEQVVEQVSGKPEPLSAEALAEKTLAEIRERNKTLAGTSSPLLSQSELDSLRAMTPKPPAEPTTQALSAEELAEKTLAEIRARNMTLAGAGASLPPLSQSELDALNEMSSNSSGDTTSKPLSTEELAEQTLAEIRERNQTLAGVQSSGPAFTQSELDALNASSAQPLAEPKSIKLTPEELAEQTLAEIRERNRILSEIQSPTLTVSQSELDSLKVENEASANEPLPVAISETELDDLKKLLSEMPSPDPEPNPTVETIETVTDQKPEWLNTLQESAQADTNPPPAAQKETLPEIDFKLPWEIEEVVSQPEGTPAATSGNETVQPPNEEPKTDEETSFKAALDALTLEPAVEPAPIATVVETPTATPTPVSEQPSAVEPVTLPVVTPSAVEISEPATPPTLKEFRFHYTCVLIPGKVDQYLTKDLSEKLNTVMPQFHLAQGWKLASLNIRPQYMLWTVCVAVGVCPQHIIHDIRGLTSAHIFANFPDIAKNKTSEDFWSSNYLAVSGTEAPPANLIQEYVAQIWKDREINTLE